MALTCGSYPVSYLVNMFTVDRRAEVEATAVAKLGVRLPSGDAHQQLSRQSIFGENGKVLAPGGTLLLMNYNMLHRGCRRLAHSRWRPMIKLKFFRTTAPTEFSK